MSGQIKMVNKNNRIKKNYKLLREENDKRMIRLYQLDDEIRKSILDL